MSMSEIIEFEGERFRVRRRPGFITRLRAILVMRAYHKAERPYTRLIREFEALEGQREAMLNKLSSLTRAGADKSEKQYCMRELFRINERFGDLAAPWAKAEAKMVAARKAVDRVLATVGFEPAS
ncbi:hypothetical protein [Brucella intermedia]|uniref:hypothetical protein n=1 Tax=Brucella intermedia TaxID=94625 RepID=UPI0034CFAA48